MKRIKNESHPQFSVIGFSTYGASYGKLIYTDRAKKKFNKNDIYILEFNLHTLEKFVVIYRGEKKPKFRNIIILTIIWTPVVLLMHLVKWVLIIFILFTSFYSQCLFKESFITDTYEKISGYISLALSVAGLISLIYFLS